MKQAVSTGTDNVRKGPRPSRARRCESTCITVEHPRAAAPELKGIVERFFLDSNERIRTGVANGRSRRLTRPQFDDLYLAGKLRSKNSNERKGDDVRRAVQSVALELTAERLP
jgi:hypothetical protein